MQRELAVLSSYCIHGAVLMDYVEIEYFSPPQWHVTVF
jgi:hypothetical protein